MKVKIEVEFNVHGLEDETITEDQAKSAAEMAVLDYLAFCENLHISRGVDSVEVEIDGYGETIVSIPEW